MTGVPGGRRPPRVVAVGERVVLARPSTGDAGEFLAAVERSRELHAGWVSPPADLEAYRAYLRSRRKLSETAYFVRTRADGALAGVVNVSSIVRGAFHSAFLGYYAFEPAAGHGYLREGLALTVEECFDRLGLHRVEANIQPTNERSLALVQALGFRHEGYSPRYLFIDGAWRDHERFALTVEDRNQGHDSGEDAARWART